MQITFDRQIGFLGVSDLPALVGSEKQIAWASDIRCTLLNAQVGDAVRRDAARASAEQLAAGLAAMTKHYQALYAITSAKFWIDHRSGHDIRLMAKNAASKAA